MTKVVSWLKFVTAKDKNAAVTQLVTWVAGVAAVFLGGAASLCKNIVINGVAVTHMDSASKVILGLSLSSVAAVVYDYRSAIDHTDTAAEPPLLPPTVDG